MKNTGLRDVDIIRVKSGCKAKKGSGCRGNAADHFLNGREFVTLLVLHFT